MGKVKTDLEIPEDAYIALAGSGYIKKRLWKNWRVILYYYSGRY